RRKLVESIGSLLEWHKGVCQKKTKIRQNIIGDSQKACWEFAEGTRKLVRNTLGDRQRKTMRLVAGDSEGCRNAGVRSLSLVVIFDCNLQVID
ncbi:hypothetical protein GW17_00059824, partial [Ensete ventricosum]